MLLLGSLVNVKNVDKSVFGARVAIFSATQLVFSVEGVLAQPASLKGKAFRANRVKKIDKSLVRVFWEFVKRTQILSKKGLSVGGASGVADYLQKFDETTKATSGKEFHLKTEANKDTAAWVRNGGMSRT